MSNVKRVTIVGVLPFDCDQDHTIKGWLATMNTPTFGLRITWGNEPKMVANEHGGQTAMYPFAIQGDEAVSYDALDTLVKAIKRLGTITENTVKDLENAG